MSTDACVVLTTFAGDANGRQIIDTLLERRLAACIQVLPIQSYYRWKGEINCDAEKLVLIKTRRSLYSQVEATIQKAHAYETPEIIQLPVEAGFADYLNWIDVECSDAADVE
ncbi:divalent cation tolerance protein CutA [bacterium]|nr:divalent cation tolerance protein CutA [bacterium]